MERIKYSMGNLKIGTDTIIINISSAMECAAAKLGLCELGSRCYALKAERLYPQVLPYRREQAKIWDRLSAHEIANDIIAINKRKRKKLKYLRLNEAGDFKNQADVWKVSTIADVLKSHNIRVYTYTHRKDLDFSDLSDNLTVNGSGFMVHNEFKTVYNLNGNIRCQGNCRICHICKARRGITIECKIH